jgi:hypothetical protein
MNLKSFNPKVVPVFYVLSCIGMIHAGVWFLTWLLWLAGAPPIVPDIARLLKSSLATLVIAAIILGASYERRS